MARLLSWRPIVTFMLGSISLGPVRNCHSRSPWCQRNRAACHLCPDFALLLCGFSRHIFDECARTTFFATPRAGRNTHRGSTRLVFRARTIAFAKILAPRTISSSEGLRTQDFEIKTKSPLRIRSKFLGEGGLNLWAFGAGTAWLHRTHIRKIPENFFCSWSTLTTAAPLTIAAVRYLGAIAGPS